MQFQGREIYWQPLLPRREKLAGSENGNSKKHSDATAAPYAIPVLDDVTGKDSPFEVMLFSHIPVMNRENLPPIRLINRSNLFTNALLPSIRNKFGNSNNSSPEISFLHIDKDTLSAYNDRPRLTVLTEKYIIKKLRASLALIGNCCFASIRVKFAGHNINLDKCLHLINKISQSSNSDDSSIFLSTARGNFTFTELFEKIFCLPPGGASEYPRFNIMTFLRLAAESINEGQSLESFLQPFKLFKPGYFSRKNIKNEIPMHVKLDGGSIFTLSEEGAAALCLSDNPASGSYMQKIFMTQCYFLYLTGYASLLCCNTEKPEGNPSLLLLQNLKRSQCVRGYLDKFMHLSMKIFSRGNTSDD